MNNFDCRFYFFIRFFTKIADTVTKICMDLYRKLHISRVLNIIESLRVPNILENCYLYNLLWKYVEKYISIQALIFLFVSSVLKSNPALSVLELIFCAIYTHTVWRFVFRNYTFQAVMTNTYMIIVFSKPVQLYEKIIFKNFFVTLFQHADASVTSVDSVSTKFCFYTFQVYLTHFCVLLGPEIKATFLSVFCKSIRNLNPS
jgi:hypothetical protein